MYIKKGPREKTIESNVCIRDVDDAVVAARGTETRICRSSHIARNWVGFFPHVHRYTLSCSHLIQEYAY